MFNTGESLKEAKVGSKRRVEIDEMKSKELRT